MNESVITLENFPLPLKVRFDDKIVTPLPGGQDNSSPVLPVLKRFAGRTGTLLLGEKSLAKVVVKLKKDEIRDRVYLVFKKSAIMLNAHAFKTIVSGLHLHITCDLGGFKCTVRQLSQIKPGDMLPLDGETGMASIYLDEYRVYIGIGEVVTVNENFGLRVRDFDLKKCFIGPVTASGLIGPEAVITAKIIIGSLDAPLQEILTIRNGTLLPLDRNAIKPVTIAFSNGLCLPGRVMVSGNRLAVRVLDPDPLQSFVTVKQPVQEEERAAPRGNPGLEEIFKHADPALISLNLQHELPQTIAFILYQMDEFKAAKVIKYLPVALQVEVTAKIVSLAQKSINSEFINILSRHFVHIANTDRPGKNQENQGVNFAATMLNYSDKAVEETVIQGLEKEYPDLAEAIKYRMFIFEDIRLLDNRSVQRVLKELDTKDLAIALKSASRELVRKIYKNMSERGADVLKQEIEYMGPVLRSEVDRAQSKIIDFIRILEENGEIVIARSGNEIV